jgi:malonate-semialdehyde dehydrogenase (acetylating)/methylmalonate-semialdehyde dehydrogenase
VEIPGAPAASPLICYEIIFSDDIIDAGYRPGWLLNLTNDASLTDAIELINDNPFANGTAIFTRSGHAARRFQQDVEVGMVGVNVPIPVPMAFFSFGGWRASLFGDLNVHGLDGVRFYTRLKTLTSRWPDDGSAAPGFHMPMMG